MISQKIPLFFTIIFWKIHKAIEEMTPENTDRNDAPSYKISLQCVLVQLCMMSGNPEEIMPTISAWKPRAPQTKIKGHS